MHFENEVNAVIADTEIMAAQPVRLLLAGLFDSLAKFLEIKHRYNEKDESYPLGLDYAYVLSKRSYDFIVSKIQKCLDDIKKGEITEDFEEAIEMRRLAIEISKTDWKITEGETIDFELREIERIKEKMMK